MWNLLYIWFGLGCEDDRLTRRSQTLRSWGKYSLGAPWWWRWGALRWARPADPPSPPGGWQTGRRPPACLPSSGRRGGNPRGQSADSRPGRAKRGRGSTSRQKSECVDFNWPNLLMRVDDNTMLSRRKTSAHSYVHDLPVWRGRPQLSPDEESLCHLTRKVPAFGGNKRIREQKLRRVTKVSKSKEMRTKRNI